MHDQGRSGVGIGREDEVRRVQHPAHGLIVALLALSACSSEGQREPPTYYEHVAPLLAQHCVQCHQSGGIAPFALDSYASVKEHAEAIRTATAERRMPPWSMTSDGTCGDFKDSLALDDAQIALLGSWVDEGMREGEHASIVRPVRAALEDAHTYSTPSFVPEVQGGELAEHDEYRCFLLDTGLDAPAFITGYDVQPGTPEIVHHVLFMLVDPEADADDPTLGKNLTLMQKLDAESPEREGWPCFSGAGDGVSVDANPVVWAPGQGLVTYPQGSGVPLRPDHKVVIQVHYNLEAHEGLSDSTEVKLRLAEHVENVGVFVLIDPLLGTLYDDAPATLEPGKASVPYYWRLSMRDVGVGEGQKVMLHGVMPHMHQLGHKYRMTIAQGDAEETCAADVQRWDFHWQRLYFYEQPIPLTADTRIGVTCDYDTTSRKEPVLPGWGTQNEMCLATLYLTVPASELAQK